MHLLACPLLLELLQRIEEEREHLPRRRVPGRSPHELAEIAHLYRSRCDFCGLLIDENKALSEPLEGR